MKQKADKNRSERSFEVGSWVYVKLQAYVQSNLKKHHHHKLGPKYYGPFLIVDKIRAVAYNLDLHVESQVHPVFHVSLLKAAPGPYSSVTPLPQATSFTVQPRAILDRKFLKKGSKASVQVLVHWRELPIIVAT